MTRNQKPVATYKNTDTKILITCKIHGDFLQTPYHHLQGKGCPNCANNTSYTNDEFIAKANTIHHDTYDYSKSVYKNNSTKVTIICKSHGEFQQTPQHHFRGQGCPKCNKSKGEIIIEQWLISNNIAYEPEKKFDGCKHKRKLPFDYYLPDHNICIEFDGEQHFYPTRYNKNKALMKKKLHDTQHRDNIKTQYCMDNNIKLIRIPYTDIDNIYDILTSYKLI